MTMLYCGFGGCSLYIVAFFCDHHDHNHLFGFFAKTFLVFLTVIADKFYVSNPIYAVFSVSQKLKLSFSTSVGFSNKVEKTMEVSVFDFCWQQSSQLKFVISDVFTS